jgi:hypothetical protein
MLILRIYEGILTVGPLRLVTMLSDMTLKFLSAVQEQLTTMDKPGVINQWLQHEPSELIKKTETWVLGK